MKRVILAGSICALILMASAPGIRPRADASRYPVHEQKEDYSIGAALIPTAQAKKMFAANLDRAGYVVVEVGVFPASGKEWFLLRHQAQSAKLRKGQWPARGLDFWWR